jgi:branched-chain amino acid transport system ATP-binding protein
MPGARTPEAPVLELRSVSTVYGQVPMLRGVSLQVGEGEIVCLLGPNGAGKSTTFNTIAGLIRPVGGEIRILGRDAGALRTEALAGLGVGFAPEGRRLFPGLTVRENMKLGFVASGLSEPFAERLEAMADLFPRVRERLDQRAGTLSGGEQAMVALARALIGRPRLLIMDEPSLGLSPKLIDEYFGRLDAIRAAGATLLLIEQNAEAALSVADRGYLLVRGEIAVSGRGAELLANETVRNLYL